MHRWILIALALGAIGCFHIVESTAAEPAPLAAAPLSDAAPVESDVFVKGEDGYHTYRIPSVIVTPKKHLLAFCEGRKNGGGDSGDIDLVVKRSEDLGKTWSKLAVVWDDAGNTVGNPCPVVDASTGVIWLPLTHNVGSDHEKEIRAGTSQASRTAWMTKSEDDGQTWSQPIEITSLVKAPNWRWYATGPGVGIQLADGRLVIPCDHTTDAMKGGAHIFYSDDHGATWKLGGAIGPPTNECQIVERTDGALLMSLRNGFGKGRRATSTSRDRGLTWSEPAVIDALLDPVCQASLLRFTTAASGGRDRLLFSNPASAKRNTLTVQLSYDEGATWPVKRLLHAGPAAYSCLTVLPDRTLGCLFECGDKGAYERIRFSRFTLGWLSEGQDRLEASK